jgi:hypothetical protein
MKSPDSDHREKPACAVKQAPVPQVFECPSCKESVEIWSDEDEAACSCGRSVSRNR